MPHALTNNLVHCTFSTKNRIDSIPDPAELGRYLGGVAKGKSIPLLIAGGTTNHVHVLIALPAAMALAHVVQELKGNSSRWLNRNGAEFGWQEGYAAFSVSPRSKKAVVAYIANQARHHEKRSFEQELLEMLQQSGIAYDKRFILG
jgi:REP element-mobilizing transposase RayT